MKRAFERDGDTLVDHYRVEGSAKETSTHIPRALLLGTGREPRRKAPSTRRVLRWMEQLLAGEWDALQAVVAHRDFPGVRDALVATAAGKLPKEEIVTTALGQVGGSGAREVLRREVAALARRPTTFRDVEFTNRAARRLTVLARDLLRMDPEATDAADALVRLFGHPVADNRMYASWNAADLFAQWRGPRTEAHSVLQKGLSALSRTRDADAFAKAIPALWDIDHEATRRRVERMLTHRDPWVRHEVVRAALKTADRGGWELAALVVRWIDTEPSLRLVAEFANVLGRLIAPARLREIAERALADESPSLRYDGVTLLGHLDGKAADELARGALSDEPDPDLGHLLLRKVFR